MLLSLMDDKLSKVAAAYNMTNDAKILNMTNEELLRHDEEIFLFIQSFVTRNADKICYAFTLHSDQLDSAEANYSALLKAYWAWKKGQTPAMSMSSSLADSVATTDYFSRTHCLSS